MLILICGELSGRPRVPTWDFGSGVPGSLGSRPVGRRRLDIPRRGGQGRPQPGDEPAPQSNPNEPRPPLHPQLTRFVASRLMIVIAIASFQTYGLFFLKDVVGLDNPAQAMGRMVLVIGGGLAVSVFITGRLSDRFGRKPLMLIGALGAAASTISLLATNDAGEVLAIASATGISVGMLLSANWALANELGTTGREAPTHWHY